MSYIYLYLLLSTFNSLFIFQFSIFKFQIILGFPDEIAAYRIMVVRKRARACSRGKIWSNGIKDGSLDQNKRGFLILSRKIRLIRVIRVQKKSVISVLSVWLFLRNLLPSACSACCHYRQFVFRKTFPCFPCDFFCAICESRSDIQSPIGTSQ